MMMDFLMNSMIAYYNQMMDIVKDSMIAYYDQMLQDTGSQLGSENLLNDNQKSKTMITDNQLMWYKA